MLTSEELKQAVVNNLLEIEPDIFVYKEARSVVSYPHFFVQQVSLADTEERKNVHLMDYVIQVRYRVASDASTDLNLARKLDEMAMKLLQNFNYIEYEGLKFRCEGKSAEKVDGVLHFGFSVQVMAKAVENDESEKMNKLDVKEVLEV